MIHDDVESLAGDPGEPRGVGGDVSAEVGGAALLHLREPGGRGEPGLQDRQQEGRLQVGDAPGGREHQPPGHLPRQAGVGR